MNNNIPDQTIIQKSINNRELVGIGKALQDYKKDVLKLQRLPMTSEALMESIEAEKAFRKAITNDLRALIEINCANCPMGYSRESCEAESCPFKTINNILKRYKEDYSDIPFHNAISKIKNKSKIKDISDNDWLIVNAVYEEYQKKTRLH